jgi:hypothetical protein
VLSCGFSCLESKEEVCDYASVRVFACVLEAEEEAGGERVGYNQNLFSIISSPGPVPLQGEALQAVSVVPVTWDSRYSLLPAFCTWSQTLAIHTAARKGR